MAKAKNLIPWSFFALKPHENAFYTGFAIQWIGIYPLKSIMPFEQLQYCSMEFLDSCTGNLAKSQQD